MCLELLVELIKRWLIPASRRLARYFFPPHYTHSAHCYLKDGQIIVSGFKEIFLVFLWISSLPIWLISCYKKCIHQQVVRPPLNNFLCLWKLAFDHQRICRKHIHQGKGKPSNCWCSNAFFIIWQTIVKTKSQR